MGVVRHSPMDMGSRMSDPFLGSNGLKQVCSMNPTLFKIYVYLSGMLSSVWEYGIHQG